MSALDDKKEGVREAVSQEASMLGRYVGAPSLG